MCPVNAGETIETRRHRLSSVPRAVRCDRTIPCANCRAAMIACRQPNDESSRQVQADRVAGLQGIVERLERRLQAVESRLATLEQPQPESNPIETRTEQLFHQLQNVIHASDGLSKSNFFFQESALHFVPPPQPLPPTLVTCILRMSANLPIFLSSYAVSDLSVVENLCQRVYSTSELASPGEIASMHGVLFFVLKELIAINANTNFVAAVETYEVLAVPSFENILALVMGKKLYLYWKLVSTAVTHCQSLGYHCESTYRGMPPQKAESVRRLFWTVYTFDKNMSLVLGRASFVQCLDIDVQYPAISADPALRAWDESFIMGIRLAELQGRIFVGLYSPGSTTRDIPAREQLISELALSMRKSHVELEQINPEGVNGPEVFSLSGGNWEILFYSTQTLLFHASSVVGGEMQISAQCFTAAQNSLRAHLDVFPRYQESQLLSNIAIGPILLSSTFVPFIVTFLHAIASKDPKSTTLLEQVLSTLEAFRSTSRGSENLYQICFTYTRVAKKLVSSQQWLPTLGGQASLRVSDISQNPSLFEPEFLQDAPLSDSSAADMDLETLDPVHRSDLLNEWLNGPSFPWERLEMDFGNCS
ncbi:fungal-specific transcription factor domain-containing protein [Aspergillus aurantiobrunneus]